LVGTEMECHCASKVSRYHAMFEREIRLLSCSVLCRKLANSFFVQSSSRLSLAMLLVFIIVHIAAGAFSPYTEDMDGTATATAAEGKQDRDEGRAVHAR
jgi:hypothetical protein